MYYLAKFCRICIKTGVQLIDLNTIDTDRVSFSEKLRICTRTVQSTENLSTAICLQCVKKLRVSYEFQGMCRKSSKVLQGYLSELISQEKLPEQFVNSELKVTIVPLDNRIRLKRVARSPHKRRITKEQRCSLLKRLLSKRTPSRKKYLVKKRRQARGGLREILNFTRGYNHGAKPPRADRSYVNDSPLTRLADFTQSFFIGNFSDYRNTILYIIESKDNMSESDDDEDMFNTPVEEVIVEPDIKIKTEPDEYDASFSCNYYVETSYSDTEIKQEMIDIDETPIKQEAQDWSEQEDSVQMLNKLVGALGQSKRTFSQYSVRCRTRGNPYINPTLKQQFELKSFMCEKCNRYFKSPGYLKAHFSKIHLC